MTKSQSDGLWAGNAAIGIKESEKVAQTNRVLKPCPHCGERPRMYHDEETGEYCIEFNNIETCLHDAFNDALFRHDKECEAIAEWNCIRRWNPE